MTPYSFSVGDLACYAISDGVYPFANGAFLFGPDAAPGDVAERLAAYGQSPDSLPIALNHLAVRTPDQFVLIDAGYGEIAAARKIPGGELHGHLESLGLRREDVATVILTHAHPDHFGGISAGGALLFPNAQFILSRAEADALPGYGDWAAARMRLIADRLRLVDDTTEVLPGIRVLPAPGHTPGNLFVELRNGGEPLLHVADLFVHPLHVERPEWSASHESDRQAAASLRRRTVEAAAVSGQRLFSCHLGFPGLGRIVRTPAGPRWRPE